VVRVSLDDFDAALTYTSFEQHLHKASTPEQRAHLETVVHHSKGEVLADLDMVMPTLSDDPQYHEFGVFATTTEDTGPTGIDQVKANYAEMVENGSYVIESKKTRVVVGDNDVVTEGTYRQILTAPVAKKLGFVKDDDTSEATHYMLTGRTIVFWEFNADGKALGEDRYVFPTGVTPLSDSELPANYPDKFRSRG
jgi:hypothetical protein